jgi:predicted nuclease of predicted toxin-antitoxin system
MPKFLIDADTPYSAVEVFTLGFAQDALHVRDVGLGDADDSKIFAYAQANGMVIVGRDLGWSNLLDYPPGSHHGLIVLRLPNTFQAEQIKAVLHAFLQDVNINEVKGALTIVEPGRYRIRTDEKDE